MPIISAEPIEKHVYRVTINGGCGIMENVVISDDGLYSIYFIKDDKCINATGRILNVVQNRAYPRNSYILFDYSEDTTNKKERIQFYKIHSIRDITPNNAYAIALKHGFEGTEDEWLKSLNGEAGKSAYQSAVDAGFVGTEAEWLDSLKGKSAYQIAIENGFLGTEQDYLKSLNGKDGKSAYDNAVEKGFEGTEDEWLASLHGKDGKSAYQIACDNGFEGTQLEWLDSLKCQEKPKSAYDIAVENGFIGTEIEWLTSLKGPNGESAYDIAVKNGFVGTEQEWLDSITDVTQLQAIVTNIQKNHLEWKVGM